MRKTQYYKFQDGLDILAERQFLQCAPKAYKILHAMHKVPPHKLGDTNMAEHCKMSIATYKRWKNHLVMVGLLQVRQLNATTYIYILGEDAIEKDDLLHQDSDYANLIKETISLTDFPYLIDSIKSKNSNSEFSPSGRDTELFQKALEKSMENPMPNEDEIL